MTHLEALEHEITQQSTPNALADRQEANVNLIEAHVLEKLKASRLQHDRLEQVVRQRAEQVREKVHDLAEIASTVINATDSLSNTLEGLLANELKPM